MADAYILLPGFSASPPQESYPKAKAAAKRALEIDDTLAEAHTSLAMAHFNEWKLADSCREFQRAIELNPNYATAHHWYGNAPLEALGRFDESIAEGKRALELDPLSLIINADLGDDYTFARQYDKAIEQLRKTIEMDPGFYFAHMKLGEAYVVKGDFEEAMAELQTARRLDDDPRVLADIGYLFAVSGRRGEAFRTLEQLKDLSNGRYVPSYCMAVVHAGLGENDQAFHWLEKIYQERSYEIVYLNTDPCFDKLRTDPRFADLVRRVGLPQ